MVICGHVDDVCVCCMYNCIVMFVCGRVFGGKSEIMVSYLAGMIHKT